MPSTDELIGSAEACEILGVSLATLTRRVKAGAVKAVKLPGLTGAYVYNRADVVAVATEQAKAKAS
jgi:predicted site-specific integrase-resolvase